MSDDKDKRSSGRDVEASIRDALTPISAEPDPGQVAQLRSQVEAARTRRPVTAPSHGTGRVSSPRRVALGLVAVALLVAGGAVGATVNALRQDSDQVVVARGDTEFDAVLTADDVDVRIEGVAAPEGRVITLGSDSLPVLPTGEYYELWFVPSGDAAGAEWISAGTFHPDAAGQTHVVLHAAVDPRLAARVELTHESDDGDPGPSRAVIAEGLIRLIGNASAQ